MVEMLIKTATRTLEWAANALNRLIPLLVIVIMFTGVIVGVKQLRPQQDSSPVVLVMPARSEGINPLSLPNALFEFDRAELRQEGVDQLHAIEGQLERSGAREIIVIGHADRSGGVAHNTELSKKRAEAVRQALAKAIPSATISAVGLGDRFPLTTPSECPGSASDRAVIDCLAKDRRVEIWARPAQAPASSAAARLPAPTK